MRKFCLTCCAVLVALSFSSHAKAQIVSPEVNADRSVTFRLRAPLAESVLVTGIHGQPPLEMELGDDGVWTGTSSVLPPELYSYTFRVDGTDTLDPSNRDVKKWLTCASLVLVPGDPPRLFEQTNVAHGSVHKHYYASTATDSQRGVWVYTPPGYRVDLDATYPVLFLLHGFGDDESAWMEVGRAHFIADNLIAQALIQPTIIVMPYGHPIPIDQRVGFDDYAGENIEVMEQDLFDDLIPFVDQHYRVAEDPQQRAIVGLSMGGGQSLTIGLRHADYFAHVGGFSSAAPQGDNEQIDSLLGGLSSHVDTVNQQLNTLWVGCGKDDFLFERNNQFVAWLEGMELAHDYHVSDGGHDWIVWREYLSQFLKICYPAEGQD